MEFVFYPLLKYHLLAPLNNKNGITIMELLKKF